MKKNFKKIIKQLWIGIKKRDPRSLLFLALISILPVFLYSIIGSLIFGITLSGDDSWLHIIIAPFYLILAYFFIYYFLYIILYKWIILPIIKKIKK